MLISIRHRLRIDFATASQRVLLHLLMTPQSGSTQQVVDWSLDLSAESRRVPIADGFGNQALFVSLSDLDKPLEITISGRIRTLSGNGVLGWQKAEPVPWLFHRVTPTTRVPASIWGKFRGEASRREDQLGAMHGLMARIHEMLGARSESEAGQSQSQSQTDGESTQTQSQDEVEFIPDQALEYARTFVGSARALGIPARFVSGYYLAEDDENVDSNTHAWAEAYIEGLGWIGFDSRLDMCPTDRHVRMAVGFDAETAAPIRAHPAVGIDDLPVETVEILVAEEADR